MSFEALDYRKMVKSRNGAVFSDFQQKKIEENMTVFIPS